MDIKTYFANVKEKVRYVLSQFPETREGGPLLTILYVWKYCEGLDIDINYIYKKYLAGELSDTETIRRTRQKIQNEEKEFLPDYSTKERKDSREKEIRRIIKEI